MLGAYIYIFGSYTLTPLFLAPGLSSTKNCRCSRMPCIPTSALSCWVTPWKRAVAVMRWGSLSSPTASCSGEPRTLDCREEWPRGPRGLYGCRSSLGCSKAKAARCHSVPGTPSGRLVLSLWAVKETQARKGALQGTQMLGKDGQCDWSLMS